MLSNIVWERPQSGPNFNRISLVLNFDVSLLTKKNKTKLKEFVELLDCSTVYFDSACLVQ